MGRLTNWALIAFVLGLFVMPMAQVKVAPVEETKTRTFGVLADEEHLKKLAQASLSALVAYTQRQMGKVPPITIVSAGQETVNGTPLPAPAGGSQGSGHNYDENDLTLIRPNSFTAGEIDAILASVGSPAAGTGASWEAAGKETGVDDGWMLAFFGQESTWQTNLKNAIGPEAHNPGNIKCSGRAACTNGYSSYSSWDAGIKDMFRLAKSYGFPTIDLVIQKWAPADSGEGNDPVAYADFVKTQRFIWQGARTTAPTPPPEPQRHEGETRSVPISVGDSDFGFNIRNALDASGGALRSVTIAPGETWSFNGSLGPVEYIPMRTVGGVPGGGWCDLASRYVQAARPIVGDGGLRFDNHIAQTGVGLTDVDPQDAVDIWTDGTPGFQDGKHDLWITNTTDRPIYFQAQQDGDQIVIIGGKG